MADMEKFYDDLIIINLYMVFKNNNVLDINPIRILSYQNPYLVQVFLIVFKIFWLGPSIVFNK